MTEGGQNRRTPQYNEGFQMGGATSMAGGAGAPSAPSSDHIFGGAMSQMSNQISNNANAAGFAGSDRVYGAAGYQNQTLTGYSQTGNNIYKVGPDGQLQKAVPSLNQPTQPNQPSQPINPTYAGVASAETNPLAQAMANNQMNGNTSYGTNTTTAYSNNQTAPANNPAPSAYNQPTSTNSANNTSVYPSPAAADNALAADDANVANQFNYTNYDSVGGDRNFDPNSYRQIYMKAPEVPTIQSLDPSSNTATSNKPGSPSAYYDTNTAEGSLDYLNAIAPTNTGSGNGIKANSKLFVILGAVLLVVIIAVSVIGAGSNAGKSSAAQKATALGTALANVQAVIKYGQTNGVYSTSLTDLSAEASIVTDSAAYSIPKEGEVLLATDNKGKEIKPVADTDVTKDLETAKANGNLDAVYAEQLDKRLTAASTAMKDLYASTNSDSTKSAIRTPYASMVEIERRTANWIKNNSSPASSSADATDEARKAEQQAEQQAQDQQNQQQGQ